MKTVKSFNFFQARTGLKWVQLTAIAFACLGASKGVQAQSIVVASTTSTEQSGLFSVLLPEFKKASGIDVKVVALGTGQAIDVGRRGDADVLFVHDKVAEEKVVSEGQKFVDWVSGSAGQATVASYKIGGEQLFFPNATK